MNKYICSLLGLLIFASTCYAHDPSAMILLIAQYGAIVMLTFVAPVPVVTFCTVKMLMTFFKFKNKIANLVFNWILPASLSLVVSIIFPVIWINKYGFNSIYEFHDNTLYFWFGSVAIAIIQLFLMLIIWNSKKSLIRKNIVNYVMKCYCGEERLTIVFWFWNMVVFNGLAFVLLYSSIIPTFIFDELKLSINKILSLDLLKLLSLSLFIGVILLFCLLFIAYAYWLLMSLIRSYKNVNKRIWVYPAVAIALAEICFYGIWLFQLLS